MTTKLTRQNDRPLGRRNATGSETATPSGSLIELAPILMHLKKIIVPWDFSEFSTKALNYALKFAEQFGAEVFVVHVVEPLPILPADVMAAPLVPDVKDERLPVITSKLHGMCQRAAKAHGLKLTPLVVHGTPYERIIEIAEKENADLLVIATHGYTGFKHFYMGSTTERVVRHASCPVLVVRDKERDFVASRKRKQIKFS